MKPKRLTDRTMRMIARRERDSQWEFMERVAREGIVWMCPWDKYKRHGPRCPGLCASKSFVAIGEQWRCAQCTKVMAHIPDDGVYVFGLIGSNEFYHWLDSHKDWWKRGGWSEKRCARSIRITDAGRKALTEQHLYDMEPIFGGMVEPGYVVTPWPRKKPKPSWTKKDLNRIEKQSYI
jgi:hypothetical protein